MSKYEQNPQYKTLILVLVDLNLIIRRNVN